MRLHLAIAQTDIALGNPEANLKTVQQVAAQAAERGAELLVLPELWGSGYMLERAQELADELNTGLFAAVATLARHHRLAICGSLLEWDAEAQQAYNTATLYDADGQLRGVYRKAHLIGLMEEDRYLGAGDRAEVIASPWGDAGLAVCYDLRFPELFRLLALRGAGILAVPAAFTLQTGKDHWELLLRARAVENQAYVVAPAQWGQKADGRWTYGRSMVIDPWGTVLATCPDRDGFALATLDLDYLDRFRVEFPALKNRRPEAYDW